MIGRAEIRGSLEAAWLLFLNRPEAMRLLDVSIDGFWRSFQAVGLILPAYALTVIADAQHLSGDGIADQAFSEPGYVIGKAAALGVDWIAFPLLLALAAAPLGVGRSYPAYIVARNWSAVLSALPFGVIALASIAGLISSSFAAVLSLIGIGVVLRYNFVVVRMALGAGIGMAVALVAADFVVSLLIANLFDRLGLPTVGQ